MGLRNDFSNPIGLWQTLETPRSAACTLAALQREPQGREEAAAAPLRRSPPAAPRLLQCPRRSHAAAERPPPSQQQLFLCGTPPHPPGMPAKFLASRPGEALPSSTESLRPAGGLLRCCRSGCRHCSPGRASSPPAEKTRSTKVGLQTLHCRLTQTCKMPCLTTQIMFSISLPLNLRALMHRSLCYRRFAGCTGYVTWPGC